MRYYLIIFALLSLPSIINSMGLSKPDHRLMLAPFLIALKKNDLENISNTWADYESTKKQDVKNELLKYCVLSPNPANRYATIKWLLKQGADPNSNKENRPSLLYYLVSKHQFNLARLFLQHNANLDAPHNTITLLHMSVKKGNVTLVRWLLDKGVKINAQTTKGMTPLHVAVKRWKKNCIQTLLTRQADPNIADSKGNTPLHYAVKHRYFSIVNLLLKNKSNPCLANNEGDTPLHLATNAQDKDIVELLLQVGVNLNVQNGIGDTSVHKALKIGDRIDFNENIVTLLLSKGADPLLYNQKKDNAFTIIVNAIGCMGYDQQMLTTILQLLLKTIKRNIKFFLFATKLKGVRLKAMADAIRYPLAAALIEEELYKKVIYLIKVAKLPPPCAPLTELAIATPRKPVIGWTQLQRSAFPIISPPSSGKAPHSASSYDGYEIF